ncbi:MAG: hypothetical protein OEZ34_09605, partial [Spirochaetia bacterium]|nr:hypothetical protein [Spirochaetia bacterium]
MPALTIKKKNRPLSIVQPADQKGIKDRLFLSVVPGNNLSLLLETLFTVHLLKKKNRGFRCEIIAASSSESFLNSTELFDAVHIFSEDQLKKNLKKFKPDVLYIPDPNLKMKMTALFGPGKFRIGGGRHRLFSWLRNHFRSGEYEDLLKLKSKGIDLIPESQEIKLNPEQFQPLLGRHGKLPDEYIWLSLFDSHELTASWPITH